MEKSRLEISDELLQNMSVDQLTELKVEIEDLLIRLDNILEDCDEVLNS